MLRATLKGAPMSATTPLSLPDREGLRSPFAMLHHVALITNDMPATVAFYRDVLGSEVALAHRLDRPDAARHYFITVAPNVVFAFFEFKDAELPEFAEATVAKSGRALDHICFFVETAAELDAWQARLAAAGVPIHGYAPGANLFFPDPNNIIFQVSVAPPGGVMGFPVHNDPEPAYETPSNA
jgi:catechol 2,3-dioxygenase-like lactoylglutathione lyase family enzyme